jgi:NhaP-type Na+/H+ or K+/H+ antiporter
MVIQAFFNIDIFIALVYAIPLSIMSSAIVIPSVGILPEQKKEFMIYNSTFSDILGIMMFYFLLGSLEAESVKQIGISIGINIFITIFVSVILSYLLILLFQKLRSEVKLFLLISVLIVIYSIGKLLHFSSLIMILIFGLILNNRHFFFSGKLKKYLDEKTVKEIFMNFRIITIESSFVVRTFFFVIFGITISIGTLLNFKVLLISLIILVVLFGIRFILLRLFVGRDIFPQVFISPRGLISILLFFAIPEEIKFEEFESGVLLFVIIASSIIMAVSLIKNKTEINNKTEIENKK